MSAVPTIIEKEAGGERTINLHPVKSFCNIFATLPAWKAWFKPPWSLTLYLILLVAARHYQYLRASYARILQQRPHAECSEADLRTPLRCAERSSGRYL